MKRTGAVLNSLFTDWAKTLDFKTALLSVRGGPLRSVTIELEGLMTESEEDKDPLPQDGLRGQAIMYFSDVKWNISA